MKDIQAVAFTDASTDSLNSASAACIFKLHSAGQSLKLKVCLLLDPLSGSEAELAGGVLALILALQFKCSFTWLTDNEPLVSLAKKYQAASAISTSSLLWSQWTSLYVELTRLGAQVEVKWVKGHAGQRENEACDRASAWVRKKGLILLTQNSDRLIGLNSKRANLQSWRLFDARGAFGSPSGEALSSLRLQIQENLNSCFPNEIMLNKAPVGI